MPMDLSKYEPEVLARLKNECGECGVCHHSWIEVNSAPIPISLEQSLGAVAEIMVICTDCFLKTPAATIAALVHEKLVEWAEGDIDLPPTERPTPLRYRDAYQTALTYIVKHRGWIT